jgi:hypothetical protein
VATRTLEWDIVWRIEMRAWCPLHEWTDLCEARVAAQALSKLWLDRRRGVQPKRPGDGAERLRRWRARRRMDRAA